MRFGRLRETAILLVSLLALGASCSLLNSSPSASFTALADSGAAPLVVSFDASSSSDPNGIVVAWRWEFGDGSTGSGETITHTYGTPGDYEAKLTVTDDQGATDSTSQTIHVDEAALTGAFTASLSSGEAPLVVDFDASGSSDPDGEIAQFAWSFGDGSTGNGGITRHIFYTPGIYAVVLTVTDAARNQDQATTTIVVLEPPRPGNQPPTGRFSATPASGKAPLSVSFDATGSSDPDGYITSYQWTFGDGKIGSGGTTSHTYSDPGTYEVWLMVTDNAGATGTSTKTIEASKTITPPPTNMPPTASFTATPASGDAPLEVSLDASASSDSDGRIVSYSWNFGNSGPLGSGVRVSHIYKDPATKTIVLTVTDNQGATATASRTIEVAAAAPPPTLVARFTATPTSGEAPLEVSFDASSSSSAPDRPITGYSWIINDSLPPVAGGVRFTYVFKPLGPTRSCWESAPQTRHTLGPRSRSKFALLRFPKICTST